MSTHEMVVLDPAWHITAQDASLAGSVQAAPDWLRHPELSPDSALRLEGPSTLVLAIIGAGTLIAYRSIHDWLIDVTPTVRTAQPAAAKPRRRAA